MCNRINPLVVKPHNPPANLDAPSIEKIRGNLVSAYSEPEAKERLSKFAYGTDDYEQGLNRIKNAKVIQKDLSNDTEGRGGWYDKENNKVFMHNQDLPGMRQASLLTHEFTHSFLGDKNRILIQDYIDNHLNQKKSDNYKDRENYNYLTDEEEVRARLNQLRQSRDANNYWKQWTPDELNNSGEKTILDELRKTMDDDKILNLLNTIASNNNYKTTRKA